MKKKENEKKKKRNRKPTISDGKVTFFMKYIGSQISLHN